MMAGGFSWASTTFVCNAEYTSAKLILVGEAPSDLNSEVQSALIGTLIFNPCRSEGCTIGFVLVVIWRKPLSQILSITTRPTLLIWARKWAPSLPSSAVQSA